MEMNGCSHENGFTIEMNGKHHEQIDDLRPWEYLHFGKAPYPMIPGTAWEHNPQSHPCGGGPGTIDAVLPMMNFRENHIWSWIWFESNMAVVDSELNRAFDEHHWLIEFIMMNTIYDFRSVFSMKFDCNLSLRLLNKVICTGWFSIATFDCRRAFCYYAFSSVNLTGGVCQLTFQIMGVTTMK